MFFQFEFKSLIYVFQVQPREGLSEVQKVLQSRLLEKQRQKTGGNETQKMETQKFVKSQNDKRRGHLQQQQQQQHHHHHQQQQQQHQQQQHQQHQLTKVHHNLAATNILQVLNFTFFLL